MNAPLNIKTLETDIRLKAFWANAVVPVWCKADIT
jgi:hypothetical protein